MNLRGGWELIKKSYLGWMAGRGFFWTLTFGWIMPSLLYLFVWVAVAGQGQVQGFTRDDFIVYYLCFIMLNQLTYPVCNWTVGDSIRMGRLSGWLLRPLPVCCDRSAGQRCARCAGAAAGRWRQLPGWSPQSPHRYSEDYEVLPSSEEAWIYVTMIRIMLRRLAYNSS